MDKYIEVVQNVLSLLDTIEEGIQHLKKQIFELRYEEGILMLEDIVDGKISIENAMEPMMENLRENKIKSLLKIFNEDINSILNLYENDNKSELEDIISNKFISDFLNWKTEVSDVLKVYTIS